MSGEKPASDDALAMLHEKEQTNRKHTSQPDEKSACKGTGVVLYSSKTCCGDAPEKGAKGQDRHHACTLSEQGEGYHCNLSA